MVFRQIKYNDSQAPIIEFTTEETETATIITVKDNGIGIGFQNQKDIFEIFRRLHGNEKYEGTGIELALCKKIVLKYDHTINVESQEDKGTSFIVKLPKT